MKDTNIGFVLECRDLVYVLNFIEISDVIINSLDSCPCFHFKTQMTSLSVNIKIIKKIKNLRFKLGRV